MGKEAEVVLRNMNNISFWMPNEKERLKRHLLRIELRMPQGQVMKFSPNFTLRGDQNTEVQMEHRQF